MGAMHFMEWRITTWEGEAYMNWRREGVWLLSIDMASRVSRSEKAFVFPIRLCVWAALLAWGQVGNDSEVTARYLAE